MRGRAARNHEWMRFSLPRFSDSSLLWIAVVMAISTLSLATFGLVPAGAFVCGNNIDGNAEGAGSSPTGMACGTVANAGGIRATAVGIASAATGDYSSAFGYDADAEGDYSTKADNNAVHAQRMITLRRWPWPISIRR